MRVSVALIRPLGNSMLKNSLSNLTQSDKDLVVVLKNWTFLIVLMNLMVISLLACQQPCRPIALTIVGITISHRQVPSFHWVVVVGGVVGKGGGTTNMHMHSSHSNW